MDEKKSNKIFWSKIINGFKKIKNVYSKFKSKPSKFDIYITNSLGQLEIINDVYIEITTTMKKNAILIRDNSMYILNNSFILLYKEDNRKEVYRSFISIQSFIVTQNNKALVKGLFDFTETEPLKSKNETKYLDKIKKAKMWVNYYKNKALMGLKSTEMVNAQYWNNELAYYKLLQKNKHVVKKESKNE